MSVTVQDAAKARRAALAAGGTPEQREAAVVPAGVRARETPPRDGQMRASTVERDGKQFLRVAGFASVYLKPYRMYDWYGPYDESVGDGAGAESLLASPDVVFLENHRGIPLSRTHTQTLDLSEPTDQEERGLWSDAFMNPKRAQAQELYTAVKDEDVREMSFAFSIVRGAWSPDYTQYRIEAYDIDRGDTSAVTFGANPHTSIEARAQQFLRTQEFMRALSAIEGPALAAAHERLAERLGATAVAVERRKPTREAVEGLRLLRDAVQRGRLATAQRDAVTSILTAVEDGSLSLTEGASLPVLVATAVEEKPANSGLSLELAEALVATS